MFGFGKKQPSESEPVKPPIMWATPAPEPSPAPAPTVASTAPPEEIDRVAAKLSFYLTEMPDLIKEQRLIAFNSRAIADHLRASVGSVAMAEAGRGRAQDIADLMAKYGDAVRQVPGAEPQDLLFLRAFGQVTLP